METKIENRAHASLCDDEEVLSLIHIWSVVRIQQDLDGCTHKRPIFEKMAKRLAEKGFGRSHMQIREKIKQLKQGYKKVQDDSISLFSLQLLFAFYRVLFSK